MSSGAFTIATFVLVPTGGYTPTQIKNYYGLNQITFNGTSADGAGQTIAIVELGDDPTLQSDLTIFDLQEGLAGPPNLTIVGQDGSSNLPAAISDTGEESLDVEWAHAIAPGANILVVEATESSNVTIALNNLFVTAGETAAAWPGVSVVSASYDWPEISNASEFNPGYQAPDSAVHDSRGTSGSDICSLVR